MGFFFAVVFFTFSFLNDCCEASRHLGQFRQRVSNERSVAKPRFAQDASLLQVAGIFSKLGGTDFRGTFGNALSGVVEAISPGSCTAELLNTGYTNDLYGEDDYPFQPACYGAGTTNSIACFPAGQTLLTPTGLQDVSQVTHGTLVAVGYEGGSYRFEPVAYFLHRDTQARFQKWTAVYWSSISGLSKIVLSPLHLIQVCGTDGSCQMKTAGNVQKGDRISVAATSGKASTTMHENCFHDATGLCSMVVVAVEQIDPETATKDGLMGLYAPATKSGTLIVNGVLVSAFSALPMLPEALHGVIHGFFQLALSPIASVVSLAPETSGPWVSSGIDVMRRATVITTAAIPYVGKSEYNSCFHLVGLQKSTQTESVY